MRKDYDIEDAFAAIEEELIDSMMRNMKRHRVEEAAEGRQWEMWQALQLRSLEEYKKKNQKKFTSWFSDINEQLEKAIRAANQSGRMEQETDILKAIKDGFKGARKASSTLQAEFFRLNERKLDALIKATTDDLKKAEHAVLRMANDRYRKAIFNAQVYANTGAGTYEKAVDMATKDMLSAGLNCVEYANGARHTLKDYADMALRTASKRAYLQGEGEMRQSWGISTVIVNKRGNPCQKCLPFCGKVLIDDVWSGGPKDGRSPATGRKYPLLSGAISAGLYHPRCKDSHTTYFEGISAPPDDTYTRDELDQIAEDYRQEQKRLYARHEAEKYGRLAKYSLDPENKRKYGARAKEWGKQVAESQNVVQDVTTEYLQNAAPGKGKVVYGNDYDKSIHKAEIDMARWIHDNLGGDIEVLNEARKYNVMTPDYKWNGKLWDLKTVTTEKSANSAVRHGLKQVKENPGGIILNYDNREISLEVLQEILSKRLAASAQKTVDILIVQNNAVLKVLRYKK